MIFSWLYLFIFLQFIYTSEALIPLVTTLAGTAGTYGSTNGEGTNARFNSPIRGDISPDGTIFLVADVDNHLLRQIIISTSTVSTLAGQAGVSGITNGAGTNALFNLPTSISYSPDGSYALVTDMYNHLIRKIIISTAMVTKFAGGSGGVSSGSTNGEGTNALFNQPVAICISPDGLTAVVADSYNHRIRKIIISTSAVSTLAGSTYYYYGSTNGIGTLSTFSYPTSVDYFPDGSAILVVDRTNHLIRKIIISTALVTTLVGTTTTIGSTNGIGTNARFYYPHDIRISPDGSYALVADRYNHMIRSIILSTLFVDTIIGTTTSGTTNGLGTNALLNFPTGVAIAPNGEYFLISDTENNMIRYAEIPGPPTMMPSLSPSLSPTHIPSISPTFAPSSSPTLIPPTRIPTYAPSFSPSISFQPTAACPPGHIRDINNEEDPTSCLSCEEGYYSDGGNENSCHPCAPLTWNIGHGNSECEFNTVRNSASDAYPITLCVFYALLSMICYGLILRFGGSWTAFLNILIITTDQITIILYSWYSLFANPVLLYLSFIFCILNLLVPMMYLLWHLSFENLLIFQWLRLCSEWYHQYDLTHGNYEENEHPKYAGWIFHSIHGWSIEAFFPFSLIYLVIDLIWIIIRILIMVSIIIGSIISQLFLLLIGVIFYTSKLMSIPVVEIWFWGQWNPTYLETHPHLTRDDSPVVYNTLILVEVCSECIPQFIIQVINSILMSERWTPLAIFSVIMSGCMIISVFHHFWYKHQKLLHSGDPTYTSFDFSRIPKYDLSENFFTSVTNQRTTYNRTRATITPIATAPPVPVPVENEVEAVIAVPARAEFVVRVEMAEYDPHYVSVMKNDERNL